MKFANFLAADRRLSILRVLQEMPGCRCNHIVMQAALAALGHDVSRDTVAADAVWLDGQRLLDARETESGVLVMTLLGYGADVAAGRTTVPGVRRPETGGA